MTKLESPHPKPFYWERTPGGHLLQAPGPQTHGWLGKEGTKFYDQAPLLFRCHAELQVLVPCLQVEAWLTDSQARTAGHMDWVVPLVGVHFGEQCLGQIHLPQAVSSNATR
jgi:hypothetical protein